MQHLEFFTEGSCKAKDPLEFLNGPIGRYMSKIYGDLVYVTTDGDEAGTRRGNFIDVILLPNDTEYTIFDTMFFNCTKSLIPYRVGYIFPGKYLNLLPEGIEDEPGVHNSAGLSMAKFGYASMWMPEDETMLEKLQQINWAKIPTTVFNDSNNYDVTDEYLANQDKTIDLLGWEVKSFNHGVAHTFCDNLLIMSCLKNTSARVQRMTAGNSLKPHFDSDVDEPYLFSGLRWYVDSKNYTGRELVVGRRSPAELASFIDSFLNDQYFNAYNIDIDGYIETARFKPEPGLLLFVNTANPLYYHAVTEMKGDGAIYTVVYDCRMHHE